MQEYLEKSSLLAARLLVGKTLCRKLHGKIFRYTITETEAYLGPQDLGSHARRGQTKSNAPMWREAGTIYIYFTYGLHYMLNIVTGPEDRPSAVLIRGLEGISGPGRVTKALGINKKLNGKKLGKKIGLWLEDEKKNQKIKVRRTARIGIDYAGPIWSKKLYRFILDK